MKPRFQYVEHLPDLISPADYASDPQGKRIKIQIVVTAEGVQVLSDAMRPEEAEKILAALGPDVIEQMLCG